MVDGDTIAAIATGLGEAGIGVIRVSGSTAVDVASRVFRPKRGLPLGARRSHSAVYGWVEDRGGDAVDEGLAVIMRGPHSYTGEDVVELHSHGGQVVVRRVLDVVLGAGARLAEPGEFTRRAFLNGRMDLSQAEAVVDVIRAKTDRALKAAVSQLSGTFGGPVRQVRERLLEAMAHLEADIDFPELELEVQTRTEVESTCRICLRELEELLAGARQGKLLRDGLRVVLAGRPNVGKSSLMNRLVRENRSIVTEVPGTTRDVVEEWVSIAGVPVVLADTAGIRKTSHPVERLGVDRSLATLEKADVVVLVIDSKTGLTEEDLGVAELIPPGAEVLGVANKSDLSPGFGLAALSAVVHGSPVLRVSAVSGEGVADLEGSIAACAQLADKEESFVANARHEECLRRAIGHVVAALEADLAGVGSDLVAIDLRSAWAALGEITGETVGEDLLDQIFSRFCIGK